MFSSQRLSRVTELLALRYHIAERLKIELLLNALEVRLEDGNRSRKVSVLVESHRCERAEGSDFFGHSCWVISVLGFSGRFDSQLRSFFLFFISPQPSDACIHMTIADSSYELANSRLSSVAHNYAKPPLDVSGRGSGCFLFLVQL